MLEYGVAVHDSRVIKEMHGDAVNSVTKYSGFHVKPGDRRHLLCHRATCKRLRSKRVSERKPIAEVEGDSIATHHK